MTGAFGKVQLNLAEGEVVNQLKLPLLFPAILLRDPVHHILKYDFPYLKSVTALFELLRQFKLCLKQFPLERHDLRTVP
jgi:hypothetical protein